MRYTVIKRNIKTWKVEADYGSFTEIEDVKAIVKGYKKDELLYEKFGFLCFTRVGSNHIYDVTVDL